jgi:hypothetical protein
MRPHTFKSILSTFFAVVVVSTFCKSGAWSMDIDEFLWKNRLLFIFSEKISDAPVKRLLGEISNQTVGILDRDLVVFKIFETGSSFMDSTQMEYEMVEEIRRRFNVSPGILTLILVGKDGTVKLRRNAPIDIEDIFAVIDAMPMRRYEIRRKSQ